MAAPLPTVTRPFILRLVIDPTEAPLDIEIPRTINDATLLDLTNVLVEGIFGDWKIDKSVKPEWKYAPTRERTPEVASRS
jgi:hypothetical protein